MRFHNLPFFSITNKLTSKRIDKTTQNIYIFYTYLQFENIDHHIAI